MKVMAIVSIPQPLSPEQQARIMPKEVPATLQLYLDGKIEQFWFRYDVLGVIFLLEVQSIEEAKTLVEGLPLGDEGLSQCEFIPVGPLAPLGLLLQGR